MKKILIIALLIFCYNIGFAQDNINTMRENARNYILAKDFNNALLVLNKAKEAYPDNMDIAKDLVLANLYKQDYPKALELVVPLTQKDDADEQSFQLAGTVYKALQDYKEAEKNYKIALAKFPESGPLYSEYGELLEILKNPDAAIKTWEKGMQVAPSYGSNYYNAAVYYFKKPEDKIWAIIYGEIFANMETNTQRTATVKKMVLDAYKQKLFISPDLAKEATHIKNEFAKAVIETFAKQSGITAQGLTPETLAMIRTRFILDWNSLYAKKFPFKLFEYHQQLMREGLFDSYNEWMFGPVNNQSAFESWANTHKEEYDKFTNFHTSRVFKMPTGQVYSSK